MSLIESAFSGLVLDISRTFGDVNNLFSLTAVVHKCHSNAQCEFYVPFH
jgi:hypothetical protein